MTTKEANAMDMVAYLSMQGFEPAKPKGNIYWYYSPFRDETEPSFKVNRCRNQWYDFGSGKGGSLLDFIACLQSISKSEALGQLEKASRLPAHSKANLPPDAPGIEIISVYYPSSVYLIRYYRSRRIADEIANQYLQEVRYKNGDKIYYALGFKNDAGGYELRSQYFKGSSHPKGVTHIKNQANSLAVFEGFFDFLSYHTIYQNQPAQLRDFLVLNSTSFFEMQLPIMQAYQRVHLYLDNDKTGSKCTALALERGPGRFIDERPFYAGYKDLSDWHQHIGSAPRPTA